MIRVFRVKAQSRMVTGIDGPFDTTEISDYFSDHPKSTVVGTAILDEVTMFIVVNEPDKR